jgi:inner membrane protein
MNFEKAYLISGAAVVLLITVYAAAILRSVLVSISMGCILSVFYSYLYMLLQMEDYAILMGSIGLFVILSGIMLITRKIDWYSISS